MLTFPLADAPVDSTQTVELLDRLGDSVGPAFRRSLHRVLTTTLDRRLFFIVGCQKSGTTLVERLLNSHRAIACRGEGRFADLLLPAFRELVAMSLANADQPP